MRFVRAAAVVLVIVMTCTTFAVASSERADADTYLVQEGDISVSMSINSATLQPSENRAFWFDVKDNSTKDVVVYINVRSAPSGVTVTYPQGNRAVVDAGEIASVQVSVAIAAIVDFSTADVDFEIKIVDPDRGLPIISNTPHVLTVTVNGNTDTGSVGKFLGLYDNNLPSFMGESWFAALVTFILIMSIGYLVCFWFIPILQKRAGGRR